MNLTPSIFLDEQKCYLTIWWQGTLLMTAFLVVAVFLYYFDQRMLADERLWAKPVKFQISVVIHFITLAVLASLLRPEKRYGAVWKAVSYSVVAAGMFEIMYIFLQAARGRESHFNLSTPIEATMYSLMGLGALTLVLGSFYLGYLLFREYQLTRTQPVLLASALGLTAGSLLTLIVASTLSSQVDNGITADPLEAIRVPLFGWYLNGQDLRIPHFFATHLMQILPLYGFWLSRKTTGLTVNYESRLFWITGIISAFIMLLFVLGLLTT